ncbi:fluoride efflux transporter FluC [Propionibacteriaceae bacterium G1746]|uniref:fluoride efflux transporter FluC n=1 Tax=Aestuariimicrobium sp. G57 TaxID=3418485 RepID=UPI003C2413A0
MNEESSRPAYLRAPLLALVALGGAAGTAMRAELGRLLPHAPGTWSWSTLLVNLVGAFVLAVLLELLGRLRRGHLPLRLMLGTGVLGGFTTYSAFSVETVQLLQSGRALLALAYVVVTVFGGLVLALLGLRLTGAHGTWGHLWAAREPGAAS